MIATVNLIVIDSASPEVIDSVHATIKDNASGWWHRMTNAWLVGGDRSASEWRNLLRSAISGTGASVLVLRLPEEGARKWAYFGPKAKERCAWIHSNYG